MRTLFLSIAIVIAVMSDASAQIRLCYFGDSITEGWIDAELRPANAYPAITDSILRTTSSHIFTSLVLGYGGETTDDAIRRIDADVLSQRPDIVVLAFGSNDRYVWGTQPAVRVQLPRFSDNLGLLVRKIQGSGARVLLLGLPPVDASRFYRYADSAEYRRYGGIVQLQHEYDSVIAAVGSSFNCVVVSTAEVFTRTDTELGFDGVHPTEAGHRIIAITLAHALQHVFMQSPSVQVPLPASIYPNPFNPDRQQWCSIAFPAHPGELFTLRIADAAGRTVRKIVYSAHTDGHHIVPWDGRTDLGTRAASGAYTVYITSAMTTIQSNLLLM